MSTNRDENKNKMTDREKKKKGETLPDNLLNQLRGTNDKKPSVEIDEEELHKATKNMGTLDRLEYTKKVRNGEIVLPKNDSSSSTFDDIFKEDDKSEYFATSFSLKTHQNQFITDLSKVLGISKSATLQRMIDIFMDNLEID